MADIVSSEDIEKAIKGLRDSKGRTAALLRETAYEIAKYHHMKTVSLIPDRPEYAEYKRALKLVQVGSSGEFFGIVVKGKAKPGDKISTKNSILFIKPTKSLKKKNKTVLILEKYSPWTVDTLPFLPSRGDAKIIKRSVTERDMKYVRKLRLKDKQKWRNELIRLGITPSATPVVLDKSVSVATDLEFIGMTLEFGLGDKKPIPHWRPPLKAIKESKPGSSWVKNKLVEAVLKNEPYKEHESWRKAKLPIVGEDYISSNNAFYKRLMAYMGHV